MENKYKLPEGKVFVLRVCHKDGKSDGQDGRPVFQWPLEIGAEVVAPDWNPEPKCGYGLHGWLWGAGDVDGAGASWGFTEEGAVWLVVEADASSIVELQGKCKYPRAVVRFTGTVGDCAAFIAPHTPSGTAIIGYTASAGYGGTASAGYKGTASAGDNGTASAGEKGSILIKRWDESLQRYRWVLGEVGIDGIEASTPYKLDENGKLVKVNP